MQLMPAELGRQQPIPDERPGLNKTLGLAQRRGNQYAVYIDGKPLAVEFHQGVRRGIGIRPTPEMWFGRVEPRHDLAHQDAPVGLRGQPPQHRGHFFEARVACGVRNHSHALS